VLVTSFRPNVNKPVWAIATTATRVYVGGEFTSINSTSRSGLALLDPSTGAVKTGFVGNLGTASNYTCSGCNPPNFAWGVHALALTSWGSDGEPTEVVVGGNFTTINSTSRLGLASVGATTGTVTSNFTTGVNSGLVRTLQPILSDMYVGGLFSTTTDGVFRGGLFVADFAGTPRSWDFTSAGSVLSLDIDWSNFNLVVGEANNLVEAYSLGGGSPVWSAGTQGDVQAVKWFDGNVYFGFHDGLVTEGDQYKLAAIAADTGLAVPDMAHTSCAWGTTTDDCWAPNNDSGGKPFSTGSGRWGVWGLATYLDSNGSRLIVGGEVQKWGPANNLVTSPLLTTFGSQ
jgi:hypothetical protein